MDTKTQMETQAQAGPAAIAVSICCTGICCFWVPMIAFGAASTIPAGCQQDLATWLQVFSLVCLIVPILMNIFITAGAMMNLRFCFKLGHGFQMIPGIFLLAWSAYGISIYNSTTEEACAPLTAYGYDARWWVWFFSVFNLIGWGITMLCLCMVCVAGLKALHEDSEEEVLSD